MTQNLFTTQVSVQILAGATISFLLLLLLVLRELAIASQDRRWLKVSRYLVIPIVPLGLAFLTLAFWRIEAFQSPTEFSKVVVGGIDLGRAFGRNPTATPYQPATATATNTLTATQITTSTPVPTRTPFQPRRSARAPSSPPPLAPTATPALPPAPASMNLPLNTPTAAPASKNILPSPLTDTQLTPASAGNSPYVDMGVTNPLMTRFYMYNCINQHDKWTQGSGG